MRKVFCAVLAVFLFFPLPAFAGTPQELSILRVSPAGEDVPGTRQIVTEFNRPVVPIGRMDRTAEEVGVSVTPEVKCQWRWINTSTLACNLDEKDALKRATRYNIHIKPVIKAQDGATLAETYQHHFTTQRPNIAWQEFRTWRSPVVPVIRLVFNQPVTKSSVAAHVFMIDGTSGVRTDLTVTADAETPETPAVLPVPREKRFLRLRRLLRISDDKPTQVNGEEARRVWLVEPVKDLTPDSSIALKMEPGLVSAEGPEPGAAERDVVVFDTFPELSFAGIRCYTTGKSELLLAPSEGPSPDRLCDPLSAVSLVFTAPVLRGAVKEGAVFSPDLAGGRKDYDPWQDEAEGAWSHLSQPHKKGRFYYVSLPYGLKAAQAYTVTIPGKTLWQRLRAMLGQPVQILEDEFGRTLPAPVSMTFSTSHRSPNFELEYHDAVLERNISSDVPLYVNNINTVTMNYRSVTADAALPGRERTQNIPKVQDVQFAIPFGVRDMLNGQSGALYGMMGTEPAVNKYPGAYRLFVQVTPFQAFLKLGHFNSMIWVTDLATGRPVPHAKVTLYADSFTAMDAPKDIRATAETDENGLALLPGVETLDPQQELLNRWQDEDTRFFLRVDRDKDMALLPLSNAFQLNTWQMAAGGGNVYAGNRDRFGHMQAWGMTAQGIYRAGDTIQYKIYVRDQDNLTLTAPPLGRYDLEIVDPTGKKVLEEKDIKLSDFGAYAGEFPVPQTGAVGWYDFNLKADFSGKEPEDKEEESSRRGRRFHHRSSEKMKFSLQPLRVLVSDFTPAPFAVSSDINGDHFKPDDKLDITTSAHLHSGGAYGEAAARATVTLIGKPFTTNDPKAAGFFFSGFSGDQDRIQLYQKKAVLDAKGGWQDSLVLPQKEIVYGTLEVESAVQDDRGKSIAALAKADYAGVDRLVGLKSRKWVYEAKKPGEIEVLVVDDKGAPAAGTKVGITIEKQVITTAKVKGAGNAYLSETNTEWKQIAQCALISATEAQVCAFTPDLAGSYRVTADIADTKNRKHQTQMYLWVTGKDYVQWDDHSETALPIVPEKKEYKVGDTARYLVRNPYPGATALVTIERYGVIDSFVKKLEGSAPVIEFPVKPDYLPGFYLSVAVMSPRADAPPPQAGQVDLAKPAFRIGYVAVPVADTYKEMQVDVKTAQEVYRPRDTIKVDIVAKPRHTGAEKQPVELAVAVLDESVFDLIAAGKTAFDPYKGFYGLQPLDMRTYSLLYRLIGLQKFDKKGANAGGDGGKSGGARNIFKYVSYWNPSIKPDAEGKAHVEFQSPDNLTGWRVLVLATTPGDRLGLGEGKFKVNRPTETRPVMPNQVHEGDTFKAGFSVMNRTDKERTLKVSISVTGDIKNGKADKEETLVLAPYKRTSVFIPLEAALLPIERDQPQGTVKFKVTAGDAADKDGMEFSLPVLKSRIIDVGANYATTTESAAKETIAFPKDIYTDTGDLSVVLSPSVIAGLEGAFRYMRDYPYPCWEQVLTRGVMASHYLNLKSYFSDSFKWDDAEKLPDETLKMAAAYQAPNGGMTYFIANDSHVDPYLSAYTAIAFTWLKSAGYKVPEVVETKLHGYLLNFLKNDTAPDFYQPGMASTVRAVALAALAKADKVTLDDITRYRPHVPEMSLFGKANFMQAALHFEGTESTLRETADMIFAAGNETGGKFMYSETQDDGYLRILATPLRDNCAILDTFIDYGKTAAGKTLIGDKPFKLVRMITQSRGSRDHWENTQENMFCMNALVRYAKAYEAEKPDMRVTAALEGKDFGNTVFKDLRDLPVTLSRSITPEDPGTTKDMTLDKKGPGRLYYATRLRYALKTENLDALNAGMDIQREYNVQRDGKWSLLKDKATIKKGDLVRVDLFLSVPAARNFVVVNDPLPGGLETVNRDLKTASSVDDAQAQYDQAGGSLWFKFTDWTEYNFSFWSFYHKELRHDSARFYADWLPAGHYHLSYAAQAIAGGVFSALPVKAEEMYDPDVYGRGKGGTLVVQDQ